MVNEEAHVALPSLRVPTSYVTVMEPRVGAGLRFSSQRQ